MRISPEAREVAIRICERQYWLARAREIEMGNLDNDPIVIDLQSLINSTLERDATHPHAMMRLLEANRRCEMNARIGALNNGEFYAFVNGYDAPEVRGTLEEVEVALGLRSAVAPTTKDVTYNVTIRFQYPAWDEVSGIVYYDVASRSKSEAIAYVRSQARGDGHTGTGKGRITFTAEEA